MAKDTKHEISSIMQQNWELNRYREELIRYLSIHFGTYLREEDIEDIYQESCIALYENIHSGKLTELTCSLKSYLLSICINKANRFLERHVLVEGKPRTEQIAQSRDPEEPGIDEGKIAMILGTTEDDCDREECFSAIRQAVSNIGEACMRILLGMYWDNASQQEIADELGYASAKVIKVKANRCRNLFRNKNLHLLEICMK